MIKPTVASVARDDNGIVLPAGVSADATQILTPEMATGSLAGLGVQKVLQHFAPSRIALLARSTQTAGGVGASVDVGKLKELIVFLRVIAATGTSPSLTVYVDASPDGGTTWAEVGAFPAVTAANEAGGLISTAPIKISNFGDTIRARYVITGTTPSFDFETLAVAKQ